MLDDALREIIGEELRRVLREELAARGELVRPVASADDFLSIKAAAQVAQVSPGTVRSWVREHHLREYRAGRVVRLRRGELVEFLASGIKPEREPTAREQAISILARRRR